MMMTSSTFHRAWVVTAGIRASGFAHLRPGVELVVYFASSTSIYAIYVIRKFTEYVTDKYSSKSFRPRLDGTETPPTSSRATSSVGLSQRARQTRRARQARRPTSRAR